MRLSDVLSKPITTDYVQIEGFLGSRKLKTGNSKKIAVGKVALNYYCNNCGDQRTFYSGEDLFCIGVNEKTISIDCVKKLYLTLKEYLRLHNTFLNILSRKLIAIKAVPIMTIK